MNRFFVVPAFALWLAVGMLSIGEASPTFAQPALLPPQPSIPTSAQHDDHGNTVAEISDDVAQVRFEKLGYKNFGHWTRDGDFLTTTATKDGKSWQLRIHVLTGAIEVKPARS